ncbi:hypothetical protein GCM10010387_24270 [Streptomyces inusitatus]|uniref:Uncharacterized protein n=1 Tax=Streptomyces inusitatus TaxID=68221 RepID=A0A918Q2B5_9ACTN|nr:hypothetical protein GCM10010387_24270 [Streptomyces inusitatus]
MRTHGWAVRLAAQRVRCRSRLQVSAGFPPAFPIRTRMKLSAPSTWITLFTQAGTAASYVRPNRAATP